MTISTVSSGTLLDRLQYTLLVQATDVILGFNNRLGNVLGDYERAVMIMKRCEYLGMFVMLG